MDALHLEEEEGEHRKTDQGAGSGSEIFQRHHELDGVEVGDHDTDEDDPVRGPVQPTQEAADDGTEDGAQDAFESEAGDHGMLRFVRG